MGSLAKKNRSIALLSRARKALAEARSLDDIIEIRDKAEAARSYAKVAKLSLEIQNEAATIKLEAERKAGVVLAQLAKNKGQIRRGRSLEPRSKVPTLADMGVSKSESHRWQLQAAVPEKRFSEYVQAQQNSSKEITSAGLIKIAKQLKAAETVRGKDNIPDGTFRDFDRLITEHRRRFSCIYADPPWPYYNQASRGSTSNHYSTMSLDDICNLPVASLAADNSHLHLWTTNAFLFESKKVMEAWGFEYKSCMMWVKPRIGPGNYWRLAHEFLLLGMRGKLPFRDRSQRSWIETPRLEHSTKPEEFRDAIKLVSPGPYLELFARRPVSDWTVWGNQVVD